MRRQTLSQTQSHTAFSQTSLKDPDGQSKCLGSILLLTLYPHPMENPAQQKQFTILLSSQIDYRNVYLCYSSMPMEHGTAPKRGQKSPKIQFPVWITLLHIMCVRLHVRHSPCFCVDFLSGKNDKYVTLLLKGLLGRHSSHANLNKSL